MPTIHERTRARDRDQPRVGELAMKIFAARRLPARIQHSQTCESPLFTRVDARGPFRSLFLSAESASAGSAVTKVDVADATMRAVSADAIYPVAPIRVIILVGGYHFTFAEAADNG